MTKEGGARVLIVDDDSQIRKMLNVALSAHHYEVKLSENGKQCLEDSIFFKPELIILDLGLPDIEGVQVIESLRDWCDVPIIVLSARQREEDKIMCLDAGADDYLTKPFGMGELLARIRASLRHAGGTPSDPITEIGNIKVDLARHCVSKEDQEINMTPIEFELLSILISNSGKVLTQQFLLKKIWGEEYSEETHYLRIYIGRLRRKLEDDPADPKHIITEPGVGYRFV